MTTTDTPRTDAAQLWQFDTPVGDLHDAEIRIKAEVSRIEMLNRELNASKAEVEKLDKERRELSRELHLWEMGMYHKPKMQAKIDELKAEVDNLKAIADEQQAHLKKWDEAFKEWDVEVDASVTR